jgi:hypothetical protein
VNDLTFSIHLSDICVRDIGQIQGGKSRADCHPLGTD